MYMILMVHNAMQLLCITIYAIILIVQVHMCQVQRRKNCCELTFSQTHQKSSDSEWNVWFWLKITSAQVMQTSLHKRWSHDFIHLGNQILNWFQAAINNAIQVIILLS